MPAAGKGAKREAGDKPAAKEPKKARKEPAAKKAEAAAPDVEMKEEPGVVGSGRVAAQVGHMPQHLLCSGGALSCEGLGCLRAGHKLQLNAAWV